MRLRREAEMMLRGIDIKVTLASSWTILKMRLGIGPKLLSYQYIDLISVSSRRGHDEDRFWLAERGHIILTSFSASSQPLLEEVKICRHLGVFQMRLRWAKTLAERDHMILASSLASSHLFLFFWPDQRQRKCVKWGDQDEAEIMWPLSANQNLSSSRPLWTQMC